MTWYAAETKPAAEYTAETEMRRVGLEVYLPQYRREYRHARSKKWLVRLFPLFQGYLFVRSDSLDLGALATCRGLERDAVLRDAKGAPVELHDEVIAEIRHKEDAGHFDELRARTGGLQPGQAVSIAHGALAGTEALVARVRSGKNVRVLVSLFNREVEASVSAAKLTRAAS